MAEPANDRLLKIIRNMTVAAVDSLNESDFQFLEQLLARNGTIQTFDYVELCLFEGSRFDLLTDLVTENPRFT